MRPVFVIGPSRSGTSLVYDILNAHPQVAVMYEAALMHLWPILASQWVMPHWTERLETWNTAFTRHRLNPADYVGTKFSSAAEVARRLYTDHAQALGAEVGGEKLPAYCDRIPLLAKAFPDACFVLNWRRPEKSLQSLARFRFTEGSSARSMAPYDLALHRHDQLLRGVQWLQRHRRPFVFLHYEAIVADPGQAFAPVWPMLGLPPLEFPFRTREASLEAIPEKPHNSVARLGALSQPHSDTPVLPSAVQARLARYQRRWKAILNDNSLPLTGGPKGSDLLLAWAANLRLDLALLLFALLPSKTWLSYRRLFRDQP